MPLFPLLVALAVGTAVGLRNVSWTGGEAIRWPCATGQRVPTAGNLFVGENVLATRLALTGDTAFVAMPRFKPGIPITLGRISLKGNKGCEASLEPFPSWSLQEEGNCSALQSVVDVFLDSQSVLWVLDTGIVDSLDRPVRRCPPKVLALNPKSGKLVRTIGLGSLTSSSSSRLQYIVADARPGRAFVYVSDAASRGLLVFEVSTGKGYRLLLPAAVSRGCASRDVLYLGLVRGCLVLSYLSGSRSFGLRTEELERGLTRGRVHDLGPKPEKLVFLGADRKAGRLFFRRQAEAEVQLWRIENCTRLTTDAAGKVYAGKSIELPTHVVTGPRGRSISVLESNFPDYFQGSVDRGVRHLINTFRL